MTPLRKTSLIFGLFFAGTFIFSIPALFFYNPLFKGNGYMLLIGFDIRVSTGALLEILTAVCNIATAVVIYPTFRRISEPVSLGYVASRTVESLMILSGVVSLMSIMTFRAEVHPEIDINNLLLIRQMFKAFHDWTFLLGPQFCSGLGTGILLGYLMYRSGAVPARMALMGMIGGTLAFLGGVMVLFDILRPMSAGLFAMTALEIIWELFIMNYAIFKGFRPLTSFDSKTAYND